MISSMCLSFVGLFIIYYQCEFRCLSCCFRSFLFLTLIWGFSLILYLNKLSKKSSVVQNAHLQSTTNFNPNLPPKTPPPKNPRPTIYLHNHISHLLRPLPSPSSSPLHPRKFIPTSHPRYKNPPQRLLPLPHMGPRNHAPRLPARLIPSPRQLHHLPISYARI